MKRINKMVFGVVVFAACLIFNSCSYLVTGFYKVENSSQWDVTDFTIEWELNGTTESEIIDLIPAGTTTTKHAVIMNNSRGNVLQTFTSNFTISYNLNGKEFTVNNSSTAQTDSEGNITDPWAYFKSDKTINIDIFDSEYIIMH